jgi:alkylhydroperoxidase/carboxymuconolactone decarboxylase family protein YurZ
MTGNTGPATRAAFRRLTLGDTALIAAMADPELRAPSVRHLDPRTEALVRVGVLVALDAPPSSFRSAVDAAQMAGAHLDDLLAVLTAVAGPVGSARVISSAPRIALAAGYDVEAALEQLEPPDDDGDMGTGPAAGVDGGAGPR